MLLDYNTLLLAIGLSSVCLAATLFGVWLLSRREGFLLIWAIGAMLLVLAAFGDSAYVAHPFPLLGAAALAPFMAGLAVLYAAAVVFRRSSIPIRQVVAIGAVSVAGVVVPMALGYDGLAFMIEDTIAAVMLTAIGLDYWRGRAAAPVPIAALTVLYLLSGLSFGLCAILLIADGAFIIGHAPSNWAEDVSLAVSIGAVTGIGALSLALNQTRLARSNRRDALTDPLTRLLNRRALFDAAGAETLPPATAVVVFDLDGFKRVNDSYGHATGDAVLGRFSEILRTSARQGDTAARIGGEEFALVLPGTTADLAALVAERIRVLFAAETFDADGETFACTVSAGIAFAAEGGRSVDTMLIEADRALYGAKRAGRNQVAEGQIRLVG